MSRVRAKGRVITQNQVAYCAIDDRSAGRKVVELDLMTEDQHSALPEDEEVTAADRLIIDSPTTSGLIVLKALAPELGPAAAGAGGRRGVKLHAADRADASEAAGTGASAGSRAGGPVEAPTILVRALRHLSQLMM